MSRKYLILIVFASLFCIGAVSASQNVTDGNIETADDAVMEDDLEVTANEDIALAENTTDVIAVDEVQSKGTDEGNLTADGDVDYYKKAVLKPATLKTTYASGKKFTVKAVSEYDSGYVLKNVDLRLRVLSDGSYKNFYATTDAKGVAHFDVSKLPFGIYKAEVSSVDEHTTAKKASATINIGKSNTKVYAPATSACYSQSKILHIKILNKVSNKPAQSVKLNIKVGKKNFVLKTNSKGQVNIKLSLFGYGKHGVIIKANDRNYKVYAKSSVFIKRMATDVYAQSVSFTQGQSKNFKIKITDRLYGFAVKNVKVLVKVGSVKHNMKTDSKGWITLNVGNLDVGTYGVYISSLNTNYIISAKSGITVNKVVEKVEVYDEDSGSSDDESASSGGTYIGNVNTYKFHYPDCSAVSRMKDSNKVYLTYQQAMDWGYSSCGICNP